MNERGFLSSLVLAFRNGFKLFESQNMQGTHMVFEFRLRACSFVSVRSFRNGVVKAKRTSTESKANWYFPY